MGMLSYGFKSSAILVHWDMIFCQYFRDIFIFYIFCFHVNSNKKIWLLHTSKKFWLLLIMFVDIKYVYSSYFFFLFFILINWSWTKWKWEMLPRKQAEI